MKEDRDGNRYPLLKNGIAIIKITDNDRYVVKTIDDEIIAITSDFNESIKRARHADKNATIKIEENGRLYDISETSRLLAPIIFRIHYYDGKFGFIAAVDVIKDGIQSDVQIFYDPYDIKTYIHHEREGRQDFMIAYTRNSLKELDHLENDKYDNELKEDDFSHLKKIVEKQKREIEREADREEYDNEH